MKQVCVYPQMICLSGFLAHALLHPCCWMYLTSSPLALRKKFLLLLLVTLNQVIQFIQVFVTFVKVIDMFVYCYRINSWFPSLILLSLKPYFIDHSFLILMHSSSRATLFLTNSRYLKAASYYCTTTQICSGIGIYMIIRDLNLIIRNNGNYTP